MNIQPTEPHGAGKDKGTAPRGRTDLAIIGAGPAGLAAAVEAKRAGLDVILLDEQFSPGGQIYRHVESVTSSKPARAGFLGKDYADGQTLARDFHASGSTYLAGATVWQIDPGTVWYLLDGRVHELKAGRILIATGATERPVPLPGWTLPGVMSVGAAQIMLKTAGAVPHKSAVLIGSGPLLYLLVQQLVAAGSKPQAIIETVSNNRYYHAARYLPSAVGSGYLSKGMGLLRKLRASSIPVYRAASDIEVVGKEEVTSVRFRVKGKEKELKTSSVFLHEGVIPNTQLTRAAGCDHVWDKDQVCFRPTADEWGNTSVEGIMIAGDGAGIGGALAAAHAGRLAALEAAFALKKLAQPKRDEQAGPVRAAYDKLSRGRRFLEVLYAPSNNLPTRDDTIVCRCEEVTAGEVRAAVGIGGVGPNQLKSYLRCGMGPCQGRMCGATITAIIAQERKVEPDKVGYFRIRPPIKPIPLSAMAGAILASDVEEQAAE